jgi:hypothetical protein
VLISSALPVKFWLSSEESFNNKAVCGVTQIPWCQPFECDDEIPLQFTDESEVEEPEIETITMPAIPALTEWLTRSISGTSPDWTTGATPTVNIPGTGTFGQSSETLYVEYPFLVGYEYSITISYDKVQNESPGPNPRHGVITIYDEDFNAQFSETESISNTTGSYTVSIVFTATEDCTIIGFRYSSGTDVDITVTDVDGTRTGLEILSDPGPKNYELKIVDCNDVEIISIPFDNLYLGNYNHLYSLSLTPSEQGICNQFIKLKIVDVDASPDNELASTDCLSIMTSQNCTLQIGYSNSKNFNNLIYSDASPVPTFYIRIPAIFFEEDHPETKEDIELSNGEIVRLYNKIEKRKKLDIGFLPPYMHEKIQFILMHDFVEIDGRTWISRGGYEKVEGNKRYPLKRASVFLHDKNFIKENQL